MAELELSITATIGRQFVPFLRARLADAHRLLKPPLRELSVALVNDARMSQLHREFMGLSGPTDVLTFPLEMTRDGNKATAGEVVVCVPEARRRAKEHGVPVAHELLLYALHGMLHLSGFDDRTQAGFRRMHAKEDEILTHLGIGATFAPVANDIRRRKARGAVR
jgi:probable rRNA maturation factor